MMDGASLRDSARDWTGNLTDAAASFDWPRVTEIIADYVAYLRTTAEPETAEIKDVLRLLQDNVRYTESRAVADAALALNPNDAAARRQYAQALVDGDNPSAALLIYSGILDDTTGPPPEHVEAHGGIGRCYKQLFVTTAEPNRRASYLQRSFDAYLGAYREDPRRYWHGINAAALLARGERDGLTLLPAPTGGSRGLADDVLRTVDDLAAMDAWAKATAAEALIAVGRYSAAIQRTKTFLRAADVDAFKIAALLRQLIEIWELDATSPPGDLILPLLRSALLEHPAAKFGSSPVTCEPSALRHRPRATASWRRSSAPSGTGRSPGTARDLSDVAPSRRSSTPTTTPSAPVFWCPARSFTRPYRQWS